MFIDAYRRNGIPLKASGKALMSRALGIDVSEFQSSIDWRQVANAGISFAYIRATLGSTYPDPTFIKNVRGARDAGLLVGAYHAFRPSQDALMQASMFSKTAGPAGSFDLPPVLDFETPNPDTWSAQRVDSVLLTRNALAFSKEVSLRFAVDCLTYTGSYFGKCLPDCEERAELARTGLWVAEYHGDNPEQPADSAHPSVPPAWPDWLFWQFSGDEGKPVPGILGHVDRDVYNGTLQDLRCAFPKTDYTP